MAGGEAEPFETFHLGNPFQQVPEGTASGIAVHVLAQQLHLAIAACDKASHLGQHVLAGAVALRPAGGGDDAVGAGVIAALGDGNQGLGSVAAPGDGRREQVVVRVFSRIHDPGLAGLDLRHQSGQLLQGHGAQHEVDVGKAPE